MTGLFKRSEMSTILIHRRLFAVGGGGGYYGLQQVWWIGLGALSVWF